MDTRKVINMGRLKILLAGLVLNNGTDIELQFERLS